MTTTTYTCEGCGRDVTRPIGDEGRRRFCSVKCGRAHQVMPTRNDRYWRKVVQNANGCWGWTGMRSAFGYGLLKTGGRGATRQESAHRISWEIHNGPVLEGMNVLHHCDNPPCSRPDHLFVGGDLENMRDRDVKGRHGTAKLKPRDIRSIRARRAQGEGVQSIADDFEISIATVSVIANRKAWRHIA